MEVEVEQAREQLTDLIEKAMRGREVVITRQHRPLVRLVEVRPTERRRRRPGSAKGLITLADDFDAPLEDFREYM
jgi:prevent-host-death family protein